MCGVLMYCGPVACNLKTCVYAPLILGASISLDSAPGLQALWYKMYKIRQSPFYLYDVSAGHYQCYDHFGWLVPICVETNWPSSWLTMAVLGCSNYITK